MMNILLSDIINKFLKIELVLKFSFVNINISCGIEVLFSEKCFPKIEFTK